MSNTDVYALKNLGLNAFLHSEVGDELNGSPLTILSVLARLGKDPWAEAGKWAKLPKATIIDCLAGSISQMPLCPQALVEARTTAARLIRLLPSQAQSSREEGDAASRLPLSVPAWVPLAVFCGVFAFWLAFEMSPPPPANPATETAGQTGDHPKVPVN